MQALLEEVEAHRPSLTEAVTSGRALEAYVQEKGATGIADLGYTRMEDRYITLEVSYLFIQHFVEVVSVHECRLYLYI